MARYAEGTSVTPERSQQEIGAILRRVLGEAEVERLTNLTFEAVAS